MSLGLLMTACKKDETISLSCEDGDCSNSVAYVSNEGAWPGNGSVSKVDLSNGEVTEFLYEDANQGVSPGIGIQSVAHNSSNAYVVSTGDAGGNLHIVDSNYKNKASLPFSYPRYIGFDSNSTHIFANSASLIFFIIILYLF